MKLCPAEKAYAVALRELHPDAQWKEILSSPQFHLYSGMYRSRGFSPHGASDGTLARIYPPPILYPPLLLRDRMCAKCGLVFFATHSPFCAECFHPCGERPTQLDSVCSRADGLAI